jgi:hypothetical protein
LEHILSVDSGLSGAALEADPMRSYWLRILLGALAIWGIGMLGVTLFRRGKVKVQTVIAGTGPITIPLPFVPFELNGSRLGTMDHLVLRRDAPKKVSSIKLQVKLDDSLVAQGLRGCRLAANVDNDSSAARGNINLRTGRMGEHTFFYCAGSDSGLVEFGEVRLLPGEVTLPLFLPQKLADELRAGEFGGSSDSADVLAARAESLASKAEWLADSISPVHERLADSLGRRGRQLGESLRTEGLRRADSARRALERLPDSLPRR